VAEQVVWSQTGKVGRMSNWFAHPLGPWIAFFTLAALGFQLWRWWTCYSQLRRLHAELSRIASAQQPAVDAAFEKLTLAPVQVGWASFRAGLSGGYSSPLSHLSWTPRLWTTDLLALHRIVWLPPLLLCLSPVLACRAILAGYERFEKEMGNLSALQVWEGSRAVFIVRHAVGSFLNWAGPGVYAGVLCLASGLALLFTATFLNWLLRKQLDGIQRQLQRIFPPLPEGGNLQKIQEQLLQMQELLLAIQAQLTESE
jgi:hypothetical protein